MRKITIVFAVILMVTQATKAQFYGTLGAQTKGATMGAGFVYRHLDASILYDTPFASESGSRSLGISLGYEMMLSHWGEDDYVFTPTFGVSNLRTRVYQMDINKEGQKIYTMTGKYSTLYPVYGFELGQNLKDGRFSLVYQHMEQPYYGMSIRVFIINHSTK